MSDAAATPYQLEHTVHRDYLRIVMTGIRSTVAASIDSWREVGRLVKASGATRVLVVSRLSGPIPSPAEQEDIIRSFATSGFDGVRTAFVLDNSVHVGALEYGELVARELGQQTRVFGSEPMALLWLRHGESTARES
jgi:hypothetical protein